MRKVVLSIHLVLGLFTAAFLVILGLTGAVLAFEPEIDRLQHWDASYVRPGGKVLSLAEIGAAVSRKYPSEAIVAYLPSESAHLSTHVILSRGIVSVNQYTGDILGVRSRGQTILGMVRVLHVRLAMGDLGRVILKWSSLATLVSLLSGVYLWWPLKRMRVGGTWWSARFWYDLHSSVGFFSLVPGLVLAGTGLALGFETPITQLVDSVTAPAIKTQQNRAGESVTDGSPISPDQAVAIAIARAPGTIPYRIQMPRFGGFYVVALHDPLHPVACGHCSITLHPVTGSIVSEHLASDLSASERLMAATNLIHTGALWGTPSKIVAALVSLLLAMQAMTGWLIWLRRKGVLHSN